ncbi:MAG: cupin-like domain-containing protein [Sphingomonadales bacterium]|nr:cupin-like domain-containing protein [Sphingomonadales bacterium]
MRTARFDPTALAALAEAYPAAPITFRHHLAVEGLLTREALADLAEFLPADSVEYNLGDLPLGVDPDAVERPALSAAEVIREIDRAGSWLALKRIEQHPDYARLLHDVLGEVREVVAARTGAMERCEAFVFVSSPHAVTPLHFDPEHNLLLQIEGEKVMTMFPVADEAIAPPRVHELFHLGAHHRNLEWRDEFQPRGRAFPLQPGVGLHVPVKAPHYVRNGPAPSISLSVTWRSEWSCAEADARAFNHILRSAGLAPKSPQPYPARNLGKSLAYRAIRRTGFVPAP